MCPSVNESHTINHTACNAGQALTYRPSIQRLSIVPLIKRAERVIQVVPLITRLSLSTRSKQTDVLHCLSQRDCSGVVAGVPGMQEDIETLKLWVAGCFDILPTFAAVRFACPYKCLSDDIRPRFKASQGGQSLRGTARVKIGFDDGERR